MEREFARHREAGRESVLAELLSDEAVEAVRDVLHEYTDICAGADTCDSRGVAREALAALHEHLKGKGTP